MVIIVSTCACVILTMDKLGSRGVFNFVVAGGET